MDVFRLKKIYLNHKDKLFKGSLFSLKLFKELFIFFYFFIKLLID